MPYIPWYERERGLAGGMMSGKRSIDGAVVTNDDVV